MNVSKVGSGIVSSETASKSDNTKRKSERDKIKNRYVPPFTESERGEK